MDIFQSRRLEDLSRHWLNFIDQNPLGDPFARETVIVGSRIMHGWLQQEFLFSYRGRQRVLANWDLQYLNVFVNDCLGIVDQAGEPETREPRFHPFSTESLQWRIFRFLRNLPRDAAYAALRYYCMGEDGEPDQDRAFSLAGELARLFDQYQVYRPGMLAEWQRNQGPGGRLAERMQWQALLWNAIHREGMDAYGDQLLRMEKTLPAAGLRSRFSRITVFGVSVMPPAYMRFFQLLGREVPVRMYVFTPCSTKSAGGARHAGMRSRAGPLEGRPLAAGGGGYANTFLRALGAGAKCFLEELFVRFAGGSLVAEQEDAVATVLRVMQDEVSQDCDDSRVDGPAGIRNLDQDRSVLIQICHGPLREVEILHDHMLRWFAEDASLQPRHIQVQVTDMGRYLPCIHAVFGLESRGACRAIPYAIADRTLVSSNAVASAFRQLLAMHESRFKASQVMELLECDALRSRFSLDLSDVCILRDWVKEAGISWGLDREHRRQLVNDCEGISGFGTWQRGIDRMLLGYAAGGIEREISGLPMDAGVLGRMLPFDAVEGDDAVLLGRFASFLDALRWLRNELGAACDLKTWAVRLTAVLDRFFSDNESSYRDLAGVRTEVAALARFQDVTGVKEAISADIVAAHFETAMAEALAGDDMVANAVVFSALRPMSSTPRRIGCVLGLNDGDFPRLDHEASFNLLQHDPRQGDRSLRREDRQAFLEAFFCARQTFYLSYVGRTEDENEKSPPSTVLAEFRDYLARRFDPRGKNTRKSEDGQTLLWCETLHRLQAFHPSYFLENGRRFSYSRENLDVARTLCIPGHPAGGADAPAVGSTANGRDMEQDIDISDMTAFLVNPARYYYRTTLQVHFDRADDSVPADSEPFELGGLERYWAGAAVADAVCSGVAPDEVRLRLQEQGVLPSGVLGEKAFNDLWDACVMSLEEGVPEAGNTSLRSLLVNNRKLCRCTVMCGSGVRLNLFRQLCLFEDDEILACVSFRNGAVRGRDRLGAWLVHLMLVASREKRVLSVVMGVDNDSLKREVFTAPAPDRALEILGEYAALYHDGEISPLPFSPETSWAWQSELCKSGDPRSGEAQARAFRKAAAAWLGGEYNRGESDDPALWHAFGDQGPMARERFKAVAQSVFGQMLFFAGEKKNHGRIAARGES